VDLGALSPTYTPDPAPASAPTNAGSYTVHCDYPASLNYNAKSNTAALTINKVDPTVTATGGTFNYDTNAHPGSCSVTGVGGINLGPLSPTYTPDPAPASAPTNAGLYTVHCDYPASENYNAKSNTAALTINKVDPTVTATGGTFNYDTNAHPGSCSVTGVGGINLGPLSPTYTPDPSPAAAPTNAGLYTVHCDYPASENYNAKSNTAALTINKVDPTVTATGGAFNYDTNAHPGSCSVTGVGGVNIGPLSPTYTPDPAPAAAPTNAGPVHGALRLPGQHELQPEEQYRGADDQQGRSDGDCDGWYVQLQRQRAARQLLGNRRGRYQHRSVVADLHARSGARFGADQCGLVHGALRLPGQHELQPEEQYRSADDQQDRTDGDGHWRDVHLRHGSAPGHLLGNRRGWRQPRSALAELHAQSGAGFGADQFGHLHCAL
jgi:hypothetical protein